MRTRSFILTLAAAVSALALLATSAEAGDRKNNRRDRDDYGYYQRDRGDDRRVRQRDRDDGRRARVVRQRDRDDDRRARVVRSGRFDRSARFYRPARFFDRPFFPTSCDGDWILIPPLIAGQSQGRDRPELDRPDLRYSALPPL